MSAPPGQTQTLSVEESLRIGAEVDTREAEVRTISEDQTRVRQNMGALKGTSEERRLNARYVKQLDEQESRLGVLKAELASLRGDQQRLQQELAELITRLSLEQTF